MEKEKLAYYKKWIKDELNTCISFWLKNGIDRENGGFYTCLDQKGEIYSTDKSVWMQGRCGWIFAYLCNTYGATSEWLEASKSCIDFMEKHCINRNKGGRMYFTVTASGEPLRQRRYCFSEAFYVMANAEYSLASGDKTALERAKKYYELIYNLNNGLIDDPTGIGEKTISKTRNQRGLADPMIYLNLSDIMRKCDPENIDLYNKRSSEVVQNIIKYHYKPELKCTLESVGINGEVEDYHTAGRMVNPGHDIECSWFMLQEALYSNNDEVKKIAINIFDNAINAGWDNEFKGILYFVDFLGKPPEAYEHDMKLWWPHNEALIASLMIYKATGDKKYLDWFDKIFEYCKENFSDPQFGEWFGYLRRDGKPTQPSTKGSTFKGPFHLPRMLIMVDKILNDI